MIYNKETNNKICSYPYLRQQIKKDEYNILLFQTYILQFRFFRDRFFPSFWRRIFTIKTTCEFISTIETNYSNFCLHLWVFAFISMYTERFRKESKKVVLQQLYTSERVNFRCIFHGMIAHMNSSRFSAVVSRQVANFAWHFIELLLQKTLDFLRIYLQKYCRY